MKSRVLPIRATSLTRYLTRHGWERVGDVGDHQVFQSPTGVKIHVCVGGTWSKNQPRIVVDKIAEAMGMRARDLIAAL